MVFEVLGRYVYCLHDKKRFVINNRDHLQMLLVRKMRFNRDRREYELKTLRTSSWKEICRTKRLLV